jgi:hypothetical protein
MAISTYSELKTSIAAWINRTDLTSVIPDFITLAEARINRTLLPRSAEEEVALTMTAGSRFVTLPDGFNTSVALWLRANTPREKLTQTLPAELPVRDNESGYPEYWAIDNGEIAFDRLAGDAYPFDFRYTKNFALSDSNTTNYVLTSAPDLYLWGSLIEASMYLKDSASAQLFEVRYLKALQDVSDSENDTRGQAPLMTELGQIAREGRFNITRGY